MIDKATEDSPEEMTRKQEQQKLERDAKFKEVIAKIEERKDITPLEKEKLTRAAARSFGAAETISNLAVQQELQRRAERDQMLSAGGIAGVVGNAAMNTPSAVMARADVMVKAGIPQAQSRAAIEGANDLMKTGRPQAKSKGAVDAAIKSSCQRLRRMQFISLMLNMPLPRSLTERELWYGSGSS